MIRSTTSPLEWLPVVVVEVVLLLGFVVCLLSRLLSLLWSKLPAVVAEVHLLPSSSWPGQSWSPALGSSPWTAGPACDPWWCWSRCQDAWWPWSRWPICQYGQDANMLGHDHHGQDWLVTIVILVKSTTENTLFTWSTPDNNNQQSPNYNKRSKRLPSPGQLSSPSAPSSSPPAGQDLYLLKNIHSSPVFSRISNNAEHKTISWPGPAVPPFNHT